MGGAGPQSQVSFPMNSSCPYAFWICMCEELFRNTFFKNSEKQPTISKCTWHVHIVWTYQEHRRGYTVFNEGKQLVLATFTWGRDLNTSSSIQAFSHTPLQALKHTFVTSDKYRRPCVFSGTQTQSHLQKHIHTLLAKHAHLHAHLHTHKNTHIHTHRQPHTHLHSHIVSIFSLTLTQGPVAYGTVYLGVFFPCLLGKVFFRNTREEREENSLLWFFCPRLDQPRRTHTHTLTHIHTEPYTHTYYKSLSASTHWKINNASL